MSYHLHKCYPLYKCKQCGARTKGKARKSGADGDYYYVKCPYCGNKGNSILNWNEIKGFTHTWVQELVE